MDFKCSFLVVTSGKPSSRSKRIWYPKQLVVPVPVRSFFFTPVSIICCRRSKYCCINTRKMLYHTKLAILYLISHCKLFFREDILVYTIYLPTDHNTVRNDDKINS